MTRPVDAATERFLDFLGDYYRPAAAHGPVQGPPDVRNLRRRAPDWQESPPEEVDHGQMGAYRASPWQRDFVSHTMRDYETIAANLWQRGLHDPYRDARDEAGMVRMEGDEFPEARPSPEGFDPHLRMAEVVRDELGLEGWEGLMAELGLAFAEPGVGQVKALGKLLATVPGAVMSILPKVPVGLQRMLAQYQHPSLVDPWGMPIQQHHGVGSGRLQPPIRATNEEGHGHSGFFTTPLTDMAREYAGRYEWAASSKSTPAQRAAWRSNIEQPLNVLENPMIGARGHAPNEYVTAATPEQINRAKAMVDEIQQVYSEVLRNVDPHFYGSNPARVGQVIADELADLRDLLNAPGPISSDEIARKLSAITRSDPWGPSVLRLGEVLASQPDASPMLRAFAARSGDQSPFGLSDFGVRLGHDGTLGPWASDWRAPEVLGVHMDNIPTEVAAFNPSQSTIFPADADTVANFLARKGVPEEEINRALASPSPERVPVGGLPRTSVLPSAAFVTPEMSQLITNQDAMMEIVESLMRRGPEEAFKATENRLYRGAQFDSDPLDYESFAHVLSYAKDALRDVMDFGSDPDKARKARELFDFLVAQKVP